MSNKTFEQEEEQAVKGADVLLGFCQKNFDEPIDALFAMVVAIACVSKATNMSLSDLFIGITLAHGKMEKGDMQ